MVRARMRRYGLDKTWKFAFEVEDGTLGACNYTLGLITLNPKLVIEGNRVQLIATILHEVAHALVSDLEEAEAHGPKWNNMLVKLIQEECWD